MKLLLIGLFLLSASAVAQHEISVEVVNVPSSKGKINVALYDKEDSFLKFEGVYQSTSTAANEGKTHLLLKNVPNGRYAIALFYDKNGNDTLDTNWIGIPKEKVAFSNAKMKLFGPPSFKECSFDLEADTMISISF